MWNISRVVSYYFNEKLNTHLVTADFILWLFMVKQKEQCFAIAQEHPIEQTTM
jgi:hypothetical protein